MRDYFSSDLRRSFYVWIKQSGDGCDYMIGCGQTLIPLEAKTKEAALEEIKQVLEDYGFVDEEGVPQKNGDRIAEHILLFGLGEIINMDDLYAEDRAERKERERIAAKMEVKIEAAKAETREREEYERLTKKFSKEKICQ